MDLDPELVAELPLMGLAEVRAADGVAASADGRLLATYEGIVYDVTSFADEHPGGRELLRTAAGLDLGHFFTNYTVAEGIRGHTLPQRVGARGRECEIQGTRTVTRGWRGWCPLVRLRPLLELA